MQMRNKLWISKVFLLLYLIPAAYARDNTTDNAGDRRPHLRIPKVEYKESSEEALNIILPDLAKQKLLSFEEKLLLPEKLQKKLKR